MAYSQGDKNVKMVLWEQMGTKMWKNGLFDIFLSLDLVENQDVVVAEFEISGYQSQFESNLG